jgi:hypothetical protein
MGEQAGPPRIETDYRVPLRFFLWLAVFFVFSGGFVLLAYGSPRVQHLVGEHPWIILVTVAAAFVCMAAAVYPFFFGIRCRRCRRKLRRMAAGTDLNTGNSPLRFHCEACHVIWETHLVSGPGSAD